MIDFLKYRWISALFSLILISSFIGGIIYKRSTRGSVFTYSVDFTGGTQVLFNFSQPVEDSAIMKALDDLGITGATIRAFSPKEKLIRVGEFESDAKGLSERIKDSLEKNTSGLKVTIDQTDSVGASVGNMLRTKSVRAVVVALLLMLLYIWFRFWSFAYAMGTVISLMHDVLVILTLAMWFNYEISLGIVGAVLFILGYSINDTIVIFARIRENLKRLGDRYSVKQIINISINEMLRRTILTSVSTLLVVISLLLFGGEALRSLSLSLFIGMVFGTYSSIYIASPVMLMLYRGERS